MIDSPAPAEGVVETNSPPSTTATSTTTTAVAAVDEVELNDDGFVVVAAEVGPDVSRLADHASTWNVARGQAIADGLVAVNTIPPPSDTDLRLLPVVVPAPEPEPAPEPDVVVPDPVEPSPVTVAPAPEPDTPEEPTPDPDAVDSDPAEEPGDGGELTDPLEPEPIDPAPDPEPTPEPAPEPIDPIIEDPGPIAPRAPAQVDGRVPPPVGGPTGAQWDAVRKCESTHNYAAISPSGLYRGAYQFSQETWDWVAGIHQPHLVGIDPINAEPAWQDVMAYTLYAMRGWNQWPICGKNLL